MTLAVSTGLNWKRQVQGAVSLRRLSRSDTHVTSINTDVYRNSTLRRRAINCLSPVGRDCLAGTRLYNYKRKRKGQRGLIEHTESSIIILYT